MIYSHYAMFDIYRALCGCRMYLERLKDGLDSRDEDLDAWEGARCKS